MSQLAFFRATTSLSLAGLTADLAMQLPPTGDPSRVFAGIATLDRAGPADVAAFEDTDDVDDLIASRAGACFLTARHLAYVPIHTIALVTEHPSRALARVAAVMHAAVAPDSVFGRGGIDPAAIIHGQAHLEQGVVVDPGVVVGPRVEIGTATTIGANSVIGAGVRIGRGCTIDTGVSLRCALIGDRVTIHSGARIGVAAAGGAPSLGRVIVQDGVTVGANAVIERGSFGDTTIGEGASVAALALVRAGATVARGERAAATAFPHAGEMV